MSDIYLGFDFGMKRIGVAVGQRITKTAGPLPPLQAKNGVPNWEELQQLFSQWRPVGLIVGLPLKIDDSEQFTTKAARAFAGELKTRFQCPVVLVDERLSTVEARALLFKSGGYRKIQQTSVDSFAASIILEQWLNYPD